jgi:NADH-quinone oxidoreductase subunit C
VTVAQEQQSDAALETVQAPENPWSRDLYFHENVDWHPAVRDLREHFGPAILDVVRFRDETTIHVRPDLLREVCDYLRTHDELSFNMLTDVTAVDMLRLRSNPRFDVVVLLYSLKNRVRLRIKAGIDDGQPVPSLVPLWRGADWLEREVYDMFGIVFEGHPNLRRMLLPDDWDEGFPLRKDTERTVARTRTRWTGRGV